VRNFVIKSDANGDFPTWLSRQSDYIDSKILAAGVARSVTVPSDAGKVFFSCTGNYYVNTRGTATVPGDIADGSSSEFNPAGYIVSPGEVISIISSAACVITIAYYR
jgi:hypothetical protein